MDGKTCWVLSYRFFQRVIFGLLIQSGAVLRASSHFNPSQQVAQSFRKRAFVDRWPFLKQQEDTGGGSNLSIFSHTIPV